MFDIRTKDISCEVVTYWVGNSCHAHRRGDAGS